MELVSLTTYFIGVGVSAAVGAFGLGIKHEHGGLDDEDVKGVAGVVILWPLMIPLLLLIGTGFGVGHLGAATARAYKRHMEAKRRRAAMASLSPEEMADKLLEGQRL